MTKLTTQELAVIAHLFWVIKIPDLNNVQVKARHTIRQNVSLENNALPQFNPIFWIDREF